MQQELSGVTFDRVAFDVIGLFEPKLSYMYFSCHVLGLITVNRCNGTPPPLKGDQEVYT